MRTTTLRLPLLVGALLALAGCGPVLETDLQKAIKAHDAVAVKRLLEAGAPLERSWFEFVPPTRLAIVGVVAAPEESVEILRLVVAAAPDARTLVNESFSHNCRKSPCWGTAPIEYAARRSSPDAVQVLIDAGLDIRSQGVANAVVAAIAEDADPMARYLIEAGADVNGWAAAHRNRFIDPISILDAARRKENAALVEYLQAKGAR